MLVTVKDVLTDLWGSWLLQHDFKNTLRGIKAQACGAETLTFRWGVHFYDEVKSCRPINFTDWTTPFDLGVDFWRQAGSAETAERGCDETAQ